MAKILTFRPGELRRDESGSETGGASAEVIVFPGVRYERWDEIRDVQSQLQTATTQSCDRQRDVLELAD